MDIGLTSLMEYETDVVYDRVILYNLNFIEQDGFILILVYTGCIRANPTDFKQ